MPKKTEFKYEQVKTTLDRLLEQNQGSLTLTGKLFFQILHKENFLPRGIFIDFIPGESIKLMVGVHNIELISLVNSPPIEEIEGIASRLYSALEGIDPDQNDLLNSENLFFVKEEFLKAALLLLAKEPEEMLKAITIMGKTVGILNFMPSRVLDEVFLSEALKEIQHIHPLVLRLPVFPALAWMMKKEKTPKKIAFWEKVYQEIQASPFFLLDPKATITIKI